MTPEEIGKLVVHVYESSLGYDVYVGRGRCPKAHHVIGWGNPFSHKDGTMAQYRVDSVEEAVAKHREWLLGKPALIARVKKELKGKVLACWCVTKKNPDAPCHARTLAEIANSD